MDEFLPKTRYVNTYSGVVKIMPSNTTKVLDAVLVGDDLVHLQYQIIKDASDKPQKSKQLLASLTTANVRVMFYSYLLNVVNASDCFILRDRHLPCTFKIPSTSLKQQLLK